MKRRGSEVRAAQAKVVEDFRGVSHDSKQRRARIPVHIRESKRQQERDWLKKRKHGQHQRIKDNDDMRKVSRSSALHAIMHAHPRRVL
jgi:hypothetical protein